MTERITFLHVQKLLPQRRRNTNKGSYGRGLLIAGSPGFSGAAVMAAASAERAGMGTLQVACPQDVKPAFCVLPEVMVFGLPEAWDGYDEAKLDERIAAASCIAAGPGLGKQPGTAGVIKKVLNSGLPCVIDADGLNALSRLPDKDCLFSAGENAVLTPHPGEMSRLCGLDIACILENPEDCAEKYAKAWGCTVLLKGADTVIAAPDGRRMINQSGNPGLAKGGSGDVLTGIILALLGQGLSPFDAACAGAYILGASADEAVKLLNQRMLMARDVIEMVENTVSGFLKEKNDADT